MTQNKDKNRDNMSLKSLKAQLRRLRQVQVPKTLKPKLLAAVPDSQAEVAKGHKAQWHLGVRDFGVTAAAAVLIIALLLLVNYGLSVPPQALLTEFNDSALSYPRWDQNDFLYGQNSAHVEKLLYYQSNGTR